MEARVAYRPAIITARMDAAGDGIGDEDGETQDRHRANARWAGEGHRHRSLSSQRVRRSGGSIRRAMADS